MSQVASSTVKKDSHLLASAQYNVGRAYLMVRFILLILLLSFIILPRGLELGNLIVRLKSGGSWLVTMAMIPALSGLRVH